MKISHYFLHQVYNHYHDYYELDREQKHHILIHLMILIMVFCGMGPMIISITNDVSFKSIAYPTFITVVALLLWGRTAYKKGNLNKYKNID
jgi:hypothetical protein